MYYIDYIIVLQTCTVALSQDDALQLPDFASARDWQRFAGSCQLQVFGSHNGGYSPESERFVWKAAAGKGQLCLKPMLAGSMVVWLSF